MEDMRSLVGCRSCWGREATASGFIACGNDLSQGGHDGKRAVVSVWEMSTLEEASSWQRAAAEEDRLEQKLERANRQRS